MNSFGILFGWAALQTTLLCAVTAAVYVMVRRRNPSAGARVAIVGVVLSALLTVGIVSPWPRWSFDGGVADDVLTTGLRPASDAQPFDAAAPKAEPAIAHTAAASQPAAANEPTSRFATLWEGASNGLSAFVGQAGFLGIRWTVWMAGVALLSMTFGAARLLAGSISVRNCVRRSRRVEDREVCDTVAALSSALGNRVPVEVRESDEVDCAATVGFRKPLILLPAEWRGWSDSERRAVLAHELAHVASGDAATWLAAQCGLMLHFYHPLMHWLAQRLRLEQELSADAAAAPLAGGSRTYLTTLAALAVRHAARPVPWPVRAFLPAPGTLLRRIDMLRNSDGSTLRASRWRTGLAVTLVVVCAAVVAGLRPSAKQTQAMGPVAIAIDLSSPILGSAATTAGANDEWGSIEGQFLLDGEIPVLKPVVAKGDPGVRDCQVCAANDVPDDSLVVNPNNKGIANICLYLVTAPKSIHPDQLASTAKEVVFDQAGCRFTPHLLVVRTDQTVLVKNGDSILHNIKTNPRRNSPQNLVLRANERKGVPLPSQMTRSELTGGPFEVNSDFHPHMRAHWLVADHPYVAVTDADGKFTIKNLPAGEHTFRVWHERPGYLNCAEFSQEVTIKVEAGKTASVGPYKVNSKEFTK
ncbi:MAG: M56 family metallopeptidase [Planctomycetaceae bacterium]